MADLIKDDLPRNEDYLDGSYGAAAGVREFRDDDLSDFDEDQTSYPSTGLVSQDQDGVISVVGGETIRLLRPDGVQPIEHYFDNLPPEAAQSPE
jgi:autophagy-related protein 2